MTKISSKSAFPLKTPAKTDYFVGTDSENNLQTVNFSFKDATNAINDFNGATANNYIFKTSYNILLSVLEEGEFYSLDNETTIASLTKLYINKFNKNGENLSDFYNYLRVNNTDFLLKLQGADPNIFSYLNIVSVEDHTDYFLFNVSLYKANDTMLELINFGEYFFKFDLKATTNATSDPLKLDKSTYTGNAQDIDDRLNILENIQDLSTNFTGQAYAIWTGTGLIYDVIYPSYYIEGVLYAGATEQITLDVADPTNPRQDVIAVDVTGAIKKTGVASPDPAAASIDTQTEIYITTVLINAGATTPANTSEEVVYKENIEWTTSSNMPSINFVSPTTPFQGTVCINTGSYSNGQYIRFITGVNQDITEVSFLKFYLNLNTIFSPSVRISIKFYNGATAVSSLLTINDGQFGYNRNITGTYQLITIPITSFTFTNSIFNKVEIIAVNASASGFKLDSFVLSKGSVYTSPLQKAFTTIVTDAGAGGATTNDDWFQLKGAGGLTTSITGKVVTLTQSSEIVNTKQNQLTAGTNITIDVTDPLAPIISAAGGAGSTDLGYTPSPTDGTVTSSTGTDATVPLADGTNAGLLKPAKYTVLENTTNTNSGDETTSTLGLTINGATAATPNDTDLVATVESSVLKKITWTNVKAFLKSYFDTLYAATLGSDDNYVTDAQLAALHPQETAATIATINHATTAKTVLVDADEVTGQDSADTFALIRTVWSDVWAYIKSKADSIYQATLVSGTNIKTINSTSILGSGDIVISGSGAKIYNVKDYGALGDGSTDDTSAIQTTINTVFAAGGGVVYFPIGVYAVNGALDTASNSQLYFPLNAFSSSVDLTTIKLLGEVCPNQYSNPFASSGSNTPSEKGVILKSNLLSAGNVIGTRFQTVSWGDFNFLHAQIENICVRVRSLTSTTPVAAQATGIYMHKMAQFNALNVEVSTTANMDVTVQPLSTAYGVVFPGNNNFVSSSGVNIMTSGMYVGISAYEHTSLDRCFMDLCYIGLTFNAGFHSSHATKLVIARCRYNIQALNNSHFVVENVSFEDDYAGYTTTPGWNETVNDIYEPSGIAYGVIKYHCVRSGYGVDYSVFTRSNPSNTELRCLKLNETSDNLITVVKISTNTTLDNSYNGKVILLTASCTLTLPNGLMIGFNYSVKTRAGVTLTYSFGGSVTVLDNLGTTMAEKLSHTMANTSTTNEYLSVGAL